MEGDKIDEETLEAEGSTRSVRKPRRWPIVVGVVAVMFVVAGAGAWVWHEQPSFCGTVCHDTMGTYLQSYENSGCLANAHAEADVVCLDCHVPTIEEQLAEVRIQLSGDYRLPLQKRDFGDGFCLRSGCHDRATLETVVVTAEDGTQVSPHTQTIDESAAQMHSPHGSGGDTLACTTCHTMHRKSEGLGYCYDSCHHTQTFEVCSDCHEVD